MTAKIRKRPRGAEPRDRRRDIYIDKTLDRRIETHAKKAALSWGALASQMLSDQLEAIQGRNETEIRARELLAWWEAMPVDVQELTRELAERLAGDKPEKQRTRKTKGGKR